MLQEESYSFENVRKILPYYEFMARELGFNPIILEHASVSNILQSIKESWFL